MESETKGISSEVDILSDLKAVNALEELLKCHYRNKLNKENNGWTTRESYPMKSENSESLDENLFLIRQEIKNIRYSSLQRKNDKLFKEKVEAEANNQFLLLLLFWSLFVNLLFILYFLKTKILN